VLRQLREHVCGAVVRARADARVSHPKQVVGKATLEPERISLDHREFWPARELARGLLKSDTETLF
jgi:hypothetical protein